jgi:peptidoglycan hydrolase-like protein with peptidoglycan-binding domain
MAQTKRKNIDTLPQYSFHDVRYGDTGRAVAFTQWLLRELGWYNGAIDGIFGQKTLSAVRKFQSAHGLHVSGIVDRPTRYALYGEAVDKGILKSMPTPYYVNNWTLKEQSTESSLETTPGTGTYVPPELLQEADVPQYGSIIGETAPEHAETLPQEYQSNTAPQTLYGMEGQPYSLPMPLSPQGLAGTQPEATELPYGMTEYWKQLNSQAPRFHYENVWEPTHWYPYDPYALYRWIPPQPFWTNGYGVY